MRWGLRVGLVATILVLAIPASAMGFGPLSSIGSFGSGVGQLDGPRGVTVGLDGTVYVAESEGNRVSAFAADGTFMRAMGKGVRPGGGDVCTAATGCQTGLEDGSDEALPGPHGVALGPEARLFVSDPANDRVVVYDLDGSFNYFFGTSRLDEPLGIEFDRSGLLHVANSGDNRIDVFTPGGDFVRGIGKDVGPGGADVCTGETGCQAGPPGDESAGAMNMPQDVALGPAGELLVTDLGNHRIDVFAGDGSFLRAFGREVNPGGGDKDVCSSECQAGSLGAAAGALEFPSALAADGAGNVYIADRNNNRISISGIDGTFLRAIGEGVIDGASSFQICTAATGCQAGGASTSAGATPLPDGVALDCRGALHVSEEVFAFARVERFGEPGTASAACVAASTPIAELATRPPSNRFRFVRLVKNRRNGSAVLFVRVPAAGKLFLWGRGSRRLRRTARRPKVVPLPIKPKIPLKRFLKRHGKARIRVNVGFEPTGGIPREREKVIALRRKRR